VDLIEWNIHAKNQSGSNILTILIMPRYTFHAFCQTKKANKNNRPILTRFAALH
jgi:hypothetical protein